MFYSLLLLSRIFSLKGNFLICWLWGIRCDRRKLEKNKLFFLFSGMGTKIEYSINLLATIVDSTNLAVGGVDVWENYQNKNQRTGIRKLQGPMDRMLDRNSVESIKKTMQMHEDIFKHQVFWWCCMIVLFILTNTKFMLRHSCIGLNSRALEIEAECLSISVAFLFLYLWGRSTAFWL